MDVCVVVSDPLQPLQYITNGLNEVLVLYVKVVICRGQTHIITNFVSSLSSTEYFGFLALNSTVLVQPCIEQQAVHNQPANQRLESSW